ncbi:unnamed protein product [Ambrosiozyma monospora]|uniref:Unnamed protein product n=1 Tax=Ambrosiozyma monospora TaxID=43982 RepID=A0ACB5T7X2_AMBMO|nr:unnamed protein product [Ambrosiozyma monospora]
MKLPYLIFAVYKVVMQCVNLFQVLSHVIDVDTKYVLIQNPPCLPLLAIVVLIKQLFHPNVKLVIDWHNLNYTVFNMKFQNLNHPAVKFMKWYEKTLSRKFAFLNLTVTEKMRLFLIEEFGLDAKRVVTLYDRPSEVFVPLKSQDELKQIVSENKEVFEGKYDQKTDRILVSATSFTEDEDFSILVDALAKLDKKLSSESTTSAKGTIWTVVTGKGPLHDHFLQLVNSHKWNRVIIKSVWLPFDQYCKILRIADLGVSLHYSTSSLDLPMKIVDLFGAGTPVISLGFDSIGELVKQGENGLILKDNKNAQEMADKIYDVLFDDRAKYLKIKQGALKESETRWDDEWDKKLWPEFALKDQ